MKRKRFWTRWPFLVLGVILVASLTLVACGDKEEVTPPPADTPTATPTDTPTTTPTEVLAPPEEQIFRFAHQEPRLLDPGVVTNPKALFYNFFDTLAEPDENGVARLAAAESYEMSPDGKTHTFVLHRDMKWSDGTPLTAHDFEWSLKRAIDPATANEYISPATIIAGADAVMAGTETDLDTIGIKALDDYTLEIKTRDPCSYMLELFAGSRWTRPVPRHVIEEWGDAWTRPEHFVNNGPWKLQSWEHDAEMVWVTNPYYYGPKPALEKIVIKLYVDHLGPEVLTAYEAGELDFAEVPLGDLARIKNDPDLSKELIVMQFPTPFFITLDTSNPPFDNVMVRQALTLAFDREAIMTNVLLDKWLPAWTFIAPGLQGYNPDSGFRGSFDDARELLALAGYPDGEGLRELELLYVPFFGPEAKLVAEAIQDQWSVNLGIKVRITTMEAGAWMDLMVTGGQYDMTVGNWASDYPDTGEIIPIMFSYPGGFYPLNWNVPEWQARAVENNSEVDADERTRVWEELERELTEQAPAIPVAFQAFPEMVKPYVGGSLFVWGGAGDPLFRYVKILEH